MVNPGVGAGIGSRYTPRHGMPQIVEHGGVVFKYLDMTRIHGCSNAIDTNHHLGVDRESGDLSEGGRW